MHPSSNCAQVYTVLGVCYQSYAVPRKAVLIWRWNQNFRRTAGLNYLQCFSWLKHWTNRFCADFCPSDASRIRVGYEQNTLINGMRLFFLRIRQTLFLKSFRKTIKAKSFISTAYLTNTLIHSTVEMFTPPTPPWHKWSDPEHRPWCLAILSVNVQWNEVEARLDCFL